MAQETTVNECLLWLRSWVEAMDMDKEAEGETSVDEAMTVTEVDKGSPVVLDSNIDDFGSPELEPVPERCGVMGGRVNQLVSIEEALTEVEELVLHGIPLSYPDCVIHRLILIEDSPPYEEAPRYSSVEL